MEGEYIGGKKGMKVQNINIRAYSETERTGKDAQDNKEKKNKNVINGAELNFASGTTEQKIAKERQALKIKLNQMISDDDYNQEMKTHLEREAELKQDSLANQKEAKEIENMKKIVKDAYGVEDGSEEQQKLEEIQELKRKQKSGELLTKEENERLNNTDDLTDYQKLMLEYDDAMAEYKKRAEDSARLAEAHGNAVEGMKQALLKVHPMVDASKQANELIQEALKEEQSNLMSEMKDNYDEKVAEEKEQAEEAKQKSEELHNTSKEDSTGEEMQRVLEAVTEVEQQKSSKKNLLLDEDLKGIEVDETV